jgi:plastocyanin
MVAFFLFPSAFADQRLYQAGFMAQQSYQGTYMAPSPMYVSQEQMYSAPEFPAASPYAAYPMYEQQAPASGNWSDVAMLAVAGAALGAAIGYKTQKQGKKAGPCGNEYCTCGGACQCGAGCQCGRPVSMLAVGGSEPSTRRELMDKAKNMFFGGLVSAGVLSSPAIANAVDVKLGSDGGQLVFVPDEVTIKAGDSVTWLGNKGMPHNVVFDEEAVPDGTDLAAINHEDMVNEEGEKVTSKFPKAGTYAYYCEPHRGAGMNGTVIVK